MLSSWRPVPRFRWRSLQPICSPKRVSRLGWFLCHAGNSSKNNRPSTNKTCWASTSRASIEAASTFGWDRIVGASGLKIGIDHFGASAPADVLANQFGFEAKAVAERVRNLLG